MKKSFRKEKLFKGLGVSPGVAVGPAHVREFGNAEIPRYQIKSSKVASELRRFVSSVKKAKDQLENLKKKSNEDNTTECKFRIKLFHRYRI